jgi:hypothetical protein
VNMNEKFELIQEAARELWAMFDTDDLETVVALVKERRAASNEAYHARANRKSGESEKRAKTRVAGNTALWKTPAHEAINLSETGKPGIETADEVRPRRSTFPKPFTEDDDFGV